MSRVAHIEIVRKAGLLILDRQGNRMGIGDEHSALAAHLEPYQEILRSRQVADVPERSTLDGSDVQVQFPAPVLDAIPVDRAPDGAKLGGKPRPCLLRADAVRCRVAA